MNGLHFLHVIVVRTPTGIVQKIVSKNFTKKITHVIWYATFALHSVLFLCETN